MIDLDAYKTLYEESEMMNVKLFMKTQQQIKDIENEKDLISKELEEKRAEN